MTQITFESNPSGPNPPVEPNSNSQVDRPEWLPENFNAPEDLAQSYAEAQAELTRAKQELATLKGAPADPPTPPANEAKPDDPKPSEDPSEDPSDAAQKVADAAGVDLTPYQSEYDQTGDVTEESREAIAKGLESVLGENARQIVDQFIEGQKVVHQNDRDLYYQEAGGSKEHLDSLLAWGTENLPDDEYAAVERQLQSRDRHSVMFAIRSLRTQYEATNGRVPNNIRPAANSIPAGTAPFKSAAELTTAMKDPRYKSDEAYRNAVKARLAVSSI